MTDKRKDKEHSKDLQAVTENQPTLTTPFLLRDESPEDPTDNEEYQSNIGTESKRLLSLGLPLALQNLLWVILGLVNTACVGRLGDGALAAAVLAQAIYNVTGNSLVIGLASGLETLCGQAYGAGNYQKVGVVFQRAMLINIVAFVVVSGGVWSHMEWILLKLGQDQAIAANAAMYLHHMIPAFLAQSLDACFTRFLLMQGIVIPGFVTTGIGATFAPFALWYTIFHKGWGLKGAAIGYSACIILMSLIDMVIVIIVETLVKRGKPNKCFHGWSMQAFRQWGPYLSYALPSYFLISLEWWAFDLLTIVAGLLRDPATMVATQGIAINLAGAGYMICLGLADGMITRVSNELGAQCPQSAKTTAKAGFMLAVVIQIIQAVGIILARNYIGYLWTDDPNVIETLSICCLALAWALMGDGVSAVMLGVLRGSGQQVLGAMLTIITYWVCGVPLGLVLAFLAGWGVPGLWVGIAVATTLQSITVTIIVSRINWSKQADDALHRVRQISVEQKPHRELPFFDPFDRSGMLSPRVVSSSLRFQRSQSLSPESHIPTHIQA